VLKAAFFSNRHHGCIHDVLHFLPCRLILQEDAVEKKSENEKAQTWNAREVAKITVLHDSTGNTLRSSATVSITVPTQSENSFLLISWQCT